MAHIANPRKNFNFTIRIPGMDEWLAQKVTIADVEIDQVEHGDANYDVKTGGRIKYGNIMVEKISTATGPDNFIWVWIRQVQNAKTGGGQLPSIYKRVIEVIEYSNDNITPVGIHTIEGVWPTKINGIELSRVTSENTIESIEFSADIQDKTF